VDEAVAEVVKIDSFRSYIGGNEESQVGGLVPESFDDLLRSMSVMPPWRTAI
jgi:hypothetical protein